MKTAVETAENIGKVFLITPEGLTDNLLHELQTLIRTRFPLADIQPAVHPPRQMEPGLAVVYYRDLPSDKEIANNLGKVVTDYLQEHKIMTGTVRIEKNSTDQTAAPFQFDVHIGPDIAANILQIGKPEATPNPSPMPKKR